MSHDIVVTRSGLVATIAIAIAIAISRPAKKNAITGEMYAALTRALRELDGEDGVRAIVLTGDARGIVDAIVEDQYLWLGAKTPLIVADWLSNRTRHELGRLNPKRVAAGRPELAAPSISTVRRRLGELNERHGWPGGRNPGFTDGGDDFCIA